MAAAGGQYNLHPGLVRRSQCIKVARGNLKVWIGQSAVNIDGQQAYGLAIHFALS